MASIARRALLPLLLLVLATTESLAQSSWAVAERDDEQIQKLVTNLRGYTETLPGGAEAPAIVLYRQITVDAQEKANKTCVNMVVEVHDPAAIPAELLAPYVWWAEGPVTARTSFLLRGGKIERKGAGELSAVRPTIGIARVDFAWGELQKGDVLGWSVITEQERPITEIAVPMAERVPMVISNVTTRGNGKYVYRARWFGMDSSDLDIKEQETKDGRPMMLRVSANQRAAVADRTLEPPFRANEPHVMVSLEEIFYDSQQEMVLSGWVSTLGWNQLAAGLAVALDDLSTKTKGTEIALGAITTGKQTAHEKAAAINDHVREKFVLLEGSEFNDGAQRDAGEVFKAKEGTKAELILLTAVLMRQSGVPVSIAVFRDPASGPLDEKWGHTAQLTEAVLRVEADGAVVYYAPQCGACEAGTLPEGWSGAKVLVWPADLAATARSENEAMMKRVMAVGTMDPAAMQAEVEKKAWARFETLP